MIRMAVGEVLLEAENTVVTERDATGHAERNLMTLASRRFPRERLARCIMYTSTEPCAMCTGVNLGRRPSRRLRLGREGPAGDHRQPPRQSDLRPALPHGVHRGQATTEVAGPLLAAEARAVHAGFWG